MRLTVFVILCLPARWKGQVWNGDASQMKRASMKRKSAWVTDNAFECANNFAAWVNYAHKLFYSVLPSAAIRIHTTSLVPRLSPAFCHNIRQKAWEDPGNEAKYYFSQLYIYYVPMWDVCTWLPDFERLVIRSTVKDAREWRCVIWSTYIINFLGVHTALAPWFWNRTIMVVVVHDLSYPDRSNNLIVGTSWSTLP